MRKGVAIFFALSVLLALAWAEAAEPPIYTVLPKDAIPAIMEPEFAPVSEAEAWMEEGEQLIGVAIGGEARAYPIYILSLHEVVNDSIGGVKFAVTW